MNKKIKKIKKNSIEDDDIILNFIEYITPKEAFEKLNLGETIRRVRDSWSERLSGYTQNPWEILSKGFSINNSIEKDITFVKDITYYSICEHHFLPFFGTVSIGYIPDKMIAGLSKFPRLVQCLANRLQVQEILTQQIASNIENYIKPLGVGVLTTGKHLCICGRGIKNESTSSTIALRGALRDQYYKAEFLQGVKNG